MSRSDKPFSFLGLPEALTLLLLLVLVSQPVTAGETDKVDQQLLSSMGSERATQGNGNKIVTLNGKTHVVWQDSTDKGYFARARTLDHKTGKWSEPVTLGQGRDNHARPTITVDSKGYLHVIIGGHHTGLQYRRSVRPGDVSEWTKVETFGKTTYPVLICGPDDTLYLAGRHDADWIGMDFYEKRPGEKWKRRGLLVRKQKKYEFYAAYHNALAWGPKHKTLHLSTGFFMGLRGDGSRKLRGLHQAVGYLRSEDFGKTWTKTDGTPVKVPATTETIDLIDEGIRAAKATDKPKPGIRHCGIVVDSKNRPFVTYVRHTPNPGHLFLATPNAKSGWEQLPIQKTVAKHWPGQAAINCSVSITSDDVMCFVITLAPLKHPNANWNPGIFGRPAFWLREHPNVQRIVWLESRDGGHTFKSREIIPHDPKLGTLLPTLEKPTGFNGVAKGKLPPLLYFVGLSRYRKPGEIIQNDTYFLQPR